MRDDSMIKYLEDLEDEDFPWVEVDDRFKEILEKRAKFEITKMHELFPIREKLVAVATCEANDSIYRQFFFSFFN